MKLHTIFAMPLAICYAASGPDWRLWNSLCDEAARLTARGDFRGALPLAIRAVEEARLAGRGEGRLAESLDTLGALRYHRAEFREAEKSLLETIAIAKPLADYRPRLAMALDKLASVYHETGGRNAGVERLRKQALDIAVGSLGPEAPQVGVHLSHLAMSLIDRRKYKEAEALLRRALRLTNERQFPALAADMYNSLGATAWYTKKYPEALESFDRSGRLFQQAGGSDSPGLVLQLISVGAVHLKIDRPAEADRALARAEDIAIKVYGADHPRVAEALSLRVKSLRKLGRRKEAGQAGERAQAIIAAQRAEVNAVNSRVDVSALAAVR